MRVALSGFVQFKQFSLFCLHERSTESVHVTDCFRFVSTKTTKSMQEKQAKYKVQKGRDRLRNSLIPFLPKTRFRTLVPVSKPIAFLILIHIFVSSCCCDQ